jgi:Transcriptional regulatory protein, C terminal
VRIYKTVRGPPEAQNAWLAGSCLTRPSRSPGSGGERAFGQAGLMRFRILGPLEVLSPDGWTAVRAAKWRSMLACLLVRPGQIVTTDSLMFELWGDNPPSTANNMVSIYVHRPRKELLRECWLDSACVCGVPASARTLFLG